jgi:predicted short-subunit dehydrogenase-like oxidoreductase (DUF2520 family)
MNATAPPRLNLIGPGRLGRTLARLWAQAGRFEIGDVIGRNAANVDQAIAFIGAGRVATWHDIRPAAFSLIASPDDRLDDVVAALAQSRTLRAGDVVFHCSGALASERLAPLRGQGARVASVHPIKSFAQPESAVASFAGTVCGCEGDPEALLALAPHFDAIGAVRIAIDPARKLLYHAGAVLACNHLVALMEGALTSMEAAGLPRGLAWSALNPLIAGALSNIGDVGTASALTGPVRRGDRDIVLAEIEATSALDADVGRVYRALSQLALRLCPAGHPIAHADLDEGAPGC